MRIRPRFNVSTRYLAVVFLTFINVSLFGQCLLPAPNAGSAFPVTNRYNTRFDIYSHIAYNTGSAIYNIASANGRYYLMGDFSNLAPQYQGRALVIDSATRAVKTQPQWRIDGAVLTAIPDGQGGFYIGGDFTKIGDSARNYIAQIDANGKPTAWNPAANGIVRMMQLRNDSLYIAGDFQKIFSRNKNSLAIYSVKGDTLVNSRLLVFGSINSFLLNKDTLILAGKGWWPIKKYSISDSTISQWELPFTEYGPVDMIRYNHDSTVIVYLSNYNTASIKAFNALTGAYKYALVTSMNDPLRISVGCFSMKAAGNKIYVAGYFESVESPAGLVNRKGFFSFDAATGTISADQLTIDGYPTFIESSKDKLYISGNFTTVNSVNRLNFAVLDIAGFTVQPWQLSPSDNITVLALDNGTAFIGGHFNGIDAVKRIGYAAVDSATGAILPWNPSNTIFTEGKRMLIKGDTLLVLGITGRPNSCMKSDFGTSLALFRLSDGQQLQAPSLGSRVTDIAIDGDYLYVSADNQVRRYYFPTLTKDISWGSGFTAGYFPMYLIVRDDKIFAVGDNRFEQPCTTLPPRKGGLSIFSKATGALLNYYPYQGNNPYYDATVFDHALLVNDKIYVQGYFSALNGKTRNNFACIDIHTGNLTDWQTPFSQTTGNNSFQYTSDLKLHNGQIWFGAGKFKDGYGNVFSGFGAIDTTTGILMPAVIDIDSKFIGFTGYGKSTSFNDFIFTDKSFIGVGAFDYINGTPVTSISTMPLAARMAAATASSTIYGVDTIYANNKPYKFLIDSANTGGHSYNWTCNINGVSFLNNGRDTVWISANTAGNGLLVVNAIDYCSNAPLAQKSIVIAAPPPALPVPDVSGITTQCFTGANASAKLNNPPAGASIVILLDGKPVNYQPADSTFIYFTGGQTATGHIVNVQYKYTYATYDSISKDFTYYVLTPVTPDITITGSTTVNGGDTTTLSSSSNPAGTNSIYQWQDSTRFHTWQNIPGATGQQVRYKPDSTGDKIRCLFTSPYFCVSPAQVASKPLSFVVHYAVTAVNDIDELSRQISLYPNPASSQIIIDTLLLSDNWRTLEITDVDGRKVMSTISIQNKTSVTIPVLQLKNGMYVALLRRKDGRLAVKPFIKQ